MSHYKINPTPFDGKNCLFDLWKYAVRNMNSWYAVLDNTHVDRLWGHFSKTETTISLCSRKSKSNFPWLSMNSPYFPKFQSLEFTMLKFHYFAGFPWPVGTLLSFDCLWNFGQRSRMKTICPLCNKTYYGWVFAWPFLRNNIFWLTQWIICSSSWRQSTMRACFLAIHHCKYL